MKKLTMNHWRVPVALISLAAAAHGYTHGFEPVRTTEIHGDIDRALFSISIPERWSGGLVMYCHPFSTAQPRRSSSKSLSQYEQQLWGPFLRAGFAVARSGFSAAGWALAEGIHDTEALRKHFVREYGSPTETYVTGHSSGGLISIALVECFPDSYEGALSLGGVNAPVLEMVNAREFDGLVLFDYYFPGILPPLDELSPGYSLRAEKIEGLLKKSPERAEQLRRLTGIRTDGDLAKVFQFFTESLADVQHRCGGNPCDNRNTIYDGTTDDHAVNDRVKRYVASASATEYLRRNYTVTGVLKDPVLALHSTYDPYVPTWVMNAYARITQRSGAQDFFVQQYVNRDGHCVFTAEEVAHAFMQLRNWKLKGVRPNTGLATSLPQ